MSKKQIKQMNEFDYLKEINYKINGENFYLKQKNEELLIELRSEERRVGKEYKT